MVNLKALQAAITRVENVRHHELTFEVDDHTITLRILRPEEEAHVQAYAQVALEDVDPKGPPDQAAYMSLMNRMRQATLGFSIVQIDDIDLREVQFIETDETDRHGNPVSLPKWEVIRDQVAEWGQHMLSEVSQRYGDLVDQADLHAQKVVKYDPVDLEAEISRVESRLKDLRAAQSKRDGAPSGGPVPENENRESVQDAANRAADQVAEARRQSEQDPQNAPSSPQSQSPQQPSQEAHQPQSPQQPQGRRSAVPTSAPPRDRSPQEAAPAGPQQPQQGETEEQQYMDEQGIWLPHEGDSFFDPSDPGQAMEIESRRQALLHQQHMARERAKAQEAQMRREMGIPTQQEMARQRMEDERQNQRPNAVDLSGSQPGQNVGSGRSTGPSVDTLRQAANLQDAVKDANAGSVRPGRPTRARPQAQAPGKPAELHGKPVYKMPTQTLDRPQKERKHGEPAPGPVQMNPTAGGRNPNFRPKGS